MTAPKASVGHRIFHHAIDMTVKMSTHIYIARSHVVNLSYYQRS